MRGLILSFILLVAASVNSSYACSLGILPLRDFDKSEFVFIGKVTGYTSPVAGKNLQGPASGLVVIPVESVFLPRTPSIDFEVFSFDLYADCSLAGQRPETLRTDFPTGTEVLVVAKDAKLIAQSPDPGVIRLEERPGDLGAVVVNLDRYGKRLSDTTSTFDYESLLMKRSQDSVAESFRPSFEARKDLYRLDVARNQTAKNVVLERLIHLPRHVHVDLEPIFEKHAANRTEADRYYEEYLKVADPPLLNLTLVQKWVLAELAKRKIEPDRAKKVFESVLMKKMDEQADGDSRVMMLGLEKTDMLARCLKILRDPK